MLINPQARHRVQHMVNLSLAMIGQPKTEPVQRFTFETPGGARRTSWAKEYEARMKAHGFTCSAHAEPGSISAIIGR